MRKINFMFLFCSFIIMSISVSAYDFSAKNADDVEIYYNIVSNENLTCEVTYGLIGYSHVNYTGSVNIPANVSYNDKTYSVVSIGTAFTGHTLLTSVIIPNTVTSIENGAFRNCEHLTTVVMPNSITTIGRSAFENCLYLKSIMIPSSVTYIGEKAFYDCTALDSVNITDIDKWAEISFYGAYANPLVYAKKLYLNGNLVKEANLTTATKIGNHAFYTYEHLIDVTIPNSVTEMGEKAFNGCTGLTSVKVHWKRPLSVPSTTFTNVDKSKCTLYVPKGTEMLYWVAPVWSEFTNIVEYDEPEDVSYYITINGLEGGEIMQKVDIGMTYSYKFKPYEEWEINSVTFNGVDVTSQLQDSIFSTPAIAGNSTLSVVYKKVSSAIDAVEGNDDVRILATSGAIVINGAKAGKAVSVYDLNGNMVESTKTNGASTTVALPQKGVYIVKVGNDVFKVSI